MILPQDVLAFYRNPDVESVRADLTAFFGRGGEAYLRFYEKRREKILAGSIFPRFSWSWPAFGSWFVWFWYRKLWVDGLVALLFPFVAGFVVMEIDLANGGSGILEIVGETFGYVLVCMVAKNSYLRSARRAISDANMLSLTGEARAEFLRRTGSTSWIGMTIGLVVFLVLMAGWVYVQWEQLNALVDTYEMMQ